MTFTEYQRSLDCITTSHLPREERIADAYRAGSGGKKPPADLDTGGFFWERMQDAFELGQMRR